ncbi:glycosyltransferase family 9 protein [candidate division KSB1 bacterium]|nr:glycosyltransferase family 9 protein [candidate division KSB1 bacterium]
MKPIYSLGNLLFQPFKIPLDRNIDLSTIKKILIMKLFAIGDVLNATPAIRNLRKLFPHAEISMLIGEWSAGVVRGNPHLDRVFVVDDQSFHHHHLWKLWLLVLKLRQEKFDLIFVFHRSLVLNLFALLVGGRFRVGLDCDGEGFPHTHRIKEDGVDHEISIYNKLPSFVGSSDLDMQMEVFPDLKDEDFSREFIRENDLMNMPIIGLCPGGARNPGEDMPQRRWDGYLELVRKLRTKDYHVVLFGGPGEEAISSRIMEGVGNGVYSLVGKATLLQTAAVMRVCKVVVAHDSGLMHLATAVKVPTIALFGPTDPKRKAPVGISHRVIYKRLLCSPCYHRGKFPECGTKECMKQITSDEVMKILMEMGESSSGS